MRQTEQLWRTWNCSKRALTRIYSREVDINRGASQNQDTHSYGNHNDRRCHETHCSGSYLTRTRVPGTGSAAGAPRLRQVHVAYQSGRRGALASPAVDLAEPGAPQF